MTAAIDMLMGEHRLIEEALSALEGCARRIEQGGVVERSAIRDFADFFANFADKCHHAKEEDRLFVAMVEHGFARDSGPVGVMLFEHTEGRAHVGALRGIGGGTGPLSEAERAAVVEHALAYVPLLRQHIFKEDRVLYPMAERTLPASAFAQMHDDFARFEAEATGPLGHARFEALVRELVSTFGQ